MPGQHADRVVPPIAPASSTPCDPALLAALGDPATYGSADVEVRETHASWVFLAGDRAYKLRKPISLGFLDYSTLAMRRSASLEEVRINEELAPGIYLGVRAIRRGAEGFTLAAGQEPAGAVDYVVEMLRFDEADTLAGLIASRRLTQAHLDGVARRLARFHRTAPVVPGGGVHDTLAMWRKNVRELAATGAPEEWDLDTANGFAEAFVSAHAHELELRRDTGLVRDGHGDLRCEHVLAVPPVRIVDRIEFDASLRHGDTACDLAFLSMDLEASGQRWAAQALVSAYRRNGMTTGSETLLAFYAAHRALIRAKVSLIAAAERDGDGRSQLVARSCSLWALSELLGWRARTPVALIICGAPASGKSTLAAELSRRSGIGVVSSDATRKAAAGLEATERAGPEHYSESSTLRTYELVADAAQRALRCDGAVIVDATCHSRAERTLLAGLRGAGITDLVVRCDVPLAVALERARQRLHEATSVSDAGPEVVAERYRTFEPLDELPPAGVLELDGRLPLDAQVQRVTRAVDRRLHPNSA
jgi:aminoglycoside phosphotransferase family enzyme/predicted kinase